MDKKKNIPAVRFKGFNNNWKNKLLAGEVDFFTGLTYSPANVVKSGGTLVLRSSNVKNSQIVLSDNVFVDSEVVNCENVKFGDIIIVVRNGSRNLIGKHALIKKNMPNTVIGAFMTGIHSKQSNFINSLLDTNQFEKEIEKNLGATINQITTGAFKKMTFWFPQENEQRQIGTFFQELEKLITLHQKKYDKLIILKKAMLVKMFPRNGATVPEIRFKGFTEDWKIEVLSELGDFKSNGVDKKIILNEYPVNLLNYMDVYNSRYLDANNCTKLMQVTAKASQLNDNNILQNDVFFTPSSETREDIGRVMVIENDLPNTVYSYHLMRFRPKLNVFHTFFPTYCFASEYVRKQLVLSAQGVQRYTLSKPAFEEITVFRPSLEEQQKIGDYFKNIDNLIEFSNLQVIKLNNIKKACLSKLFVALD